MFFINLTMLRPGFFYLTAERRETRRVRCENTNLSLESECPDAFGLVNFMSLDPGISGLCILSSKANNIVPVSTLNNLLIN